MDPWQFDSKYTLGEVQQHNSADDCWMVIFDKVYDITEFVNEHPGGDYILLEYAGRDATVPFLSSRHGSSAYKLLDKYWIGILVDEELYYSNNSSYCSVYSNLSWRVPQSAAGSGKPTLKSSAGGSEESGETSEDEEEEDDDGVDSRLDLSEGEPARVCEFEGREAAEKEDEAERAEKAEGEAACESSDSAGALAWTADSAARLLRLWTKAARALLRVKSVSSSQAQVVRHLALASGCHIL